MVRPRDIPRKIGNIDEDKMARAVNFVLEKNHSIREAARKMGIPHQTLFRYVKKKKTQPEENVRMGPNYAVRKIFTDEQELALCEYCETCSKMAYGLSTTALRRLAFEMAERNNLKMPSSWMATKSAGLEWMRGFLHRHKTLSIRQPEGCSLSRLTSFNEHNVKKFFENLHNILDRHPQLADGSRIYNLDETGTTTAQKPKKVIARKGEKQVHQCTSADRGVLVTTTAIISAGGTFLPPVLTFPRKNFKTHMLNGSPPGTLGLASPTGWMNAELFIKVMEHFIKHSHSSKEAPTLLILDNHESHMSIEVLEMARSAGVTLLTLPPHCSNKLQPLDIAVFGPFKAYYNAAVDSWMMRNPGVPMTIYQIAECVGVAHIKAMTPTNIISGFTKSGIYPFDDAIFQDSDFLPSSVTDRPEIQDPIPSCSGMSQGDGPSVHISDDIPEPAALTFVSPKDIAGYPKAGPRKRKSGGRKPGRSIILTDTPEKAIIEEKSNLKHLKQLKKANKVSKGLALKSLKRRQTVQKDLSDSTSDEDTQMVLDDSSCEEDDSFEIKEPNREPVIDDFVLVRFPNNVFYVGKILTGKDENGDFEVSYLRKSMKTAGFVMPHVSDIASVAEPDIAMVLPRPQLMKTKRLAGYHQFPISFGNLDVR